MDIRRAFSVSAGAHAVALTLLFGAGGLRGCRTRPPRREAVFVELVREAAPVPAPRAAEPLPPQPEPPPPPPAEPRARPPVQTSQRRIPRQPPAPRPPALTEAQVREMLERNLPPAPAVPRTDDFPAWYFALVRQALYEAWIQPSGLSAASGLRVEATLRVRRDGRILSKTITRRSGNPAMDESVQRALDGVDRLRPLPDTFRGEYRDISIGFELTGL